MILHDTIYDWDGKSREGEQPICWWPGSYYIRIVDFSQGPANITHLKPLAVICKNRGHGTSIKKCIQNFAKRVAADFNFDMDKAFWVEIESDDDAISVANLKFERQIGEKRLYSVTWRNAMPKEATLLEPFIKDFGREDNG